MKIDLHCHSRASDGSLTPTELVQRAINQQVSILALTDHDTIAGLAEAKVAANGSSLKVIDGVEISTSWRNWEIHIVGLNFDIDNEPLQQLLMRQSHWRQQRAELIEQKLVKRGFDGVLAQARVYADGGNIGRSHFAKAMVDMGLVATPQLAFDKYLGKGESAYVGNQWCPLAEAVAHINNAGGMAVLAHPAKYQLSNKWLRMLTADFVEAGGEAIETIHCQQNQQQQQFLQLLAKEQNLLLSAGSDFHGPSRWLELGRGLHRPDQPGVWHHFGWIEEGQ
ncbi:PHP domain-containing protein [Ferrimonas lipolytica]|uniref:PHP domain-containing protein n=1 Tax=Ferrimonas lipolytica TaxID=2724191 RepID=A0A6H1UA12_9GAMM|nr:PHP domain-containing protein [Ferrimonas lipolytica]QIZ75874.1 PHP domain-containing protein [Ferrimonas lipolytica]